MHRFLKRKESILICAIDILDELGVHGLTSKEIAKRQGITEPAVYKQFTGKQDILLAIMERFAAFDELIMNTMIENKIAFPEGIRYFARSFSEYYENYPQITTVMFSYDMLKYEEETYRKMQMIINRRLNFLTDFVKKGQADGDAVNTMDSGIYAEMLHGIIWSCTYTWKLNHCSYSLKERLLPAVDVLLNIK